MSSHSFCKCSSKASKTFYLEWENYCNLGISFTSTFCFLFHWDIEHMNYDRTMVNIILFPIKEYFWILISTKYSSISRKKICLNASTIHMHHYASHNWSTCRDGALVMDIRIAMNYWCPIYSTHHLVAYREEMKTWKSYSILLNFSCLSLVFG